MLTRVFEGYESPLLHYQEIPFPEAHAELVCICNEGADSLTQQIVRFIGKEFQKAQ